MVFVLPQEYPVENIVNDSITHTSSVIIKFIELADDGWMTPLDNFRV